MGRKAYKATPKEEKIIARMAANGLDIQMICDYLGICIQTFETHPELQAIYRKNFSGLVEKVAQTLIQKALETQDNILMMFLMKTRGKWSEQSYVKFNEFEGDYYTKKSAIDTAFKQGRISIENYCKLSGSLTDQFKVDEVLEIKNRLDKLENNPSV